MVHRLAIGEAAATAMRKQFDASSLTTTKPCSGAGGARRRVRGALQGALRHNPRRGRWRVLNSTIRVVSAPYGEKSCRGAYLAPAFRLFRARFALYGTWYSTECCSSVLASLRTCSFVAGLVLCSRVETLEVRSPQPARAARSARSARLACELARTRSTRKGQCLARRPSWAPRQGIASRSKQSERTAATARRYLHCHHGQLVTLWASHHPCERP